MGGKAALFIVLGFSMIFMVAGMNVNQMSTQSSDNMFNYYNEAKMYHMASGAVNIIVNKIYNNAGIPDQTFNFDFDGGEIEATLTTKDTKLDLKELLVTANYADTFRTVRIMLKPSMFSKFAYFSDYESLSGTINWTTADTVWGPFHTNDDLDISGNPVFYGEVSFGGKENKASGSKPVYYGGKRSPVKIAIPTDGVSKVSSQSSGGRKLTNASGTLYFDFRGDSIRYRYKTTSPWIYELASTFIPNGVIYAENMNVYLKGTVKGEYSLAVSGTNTSGKGNIYIEDDIVYNDNPITNPNSTDMLGLVAKNSVIISKNTANQTDVKIQAAIYCESYSFTVQDYTDGTPRGAIYLYGGITQKYRGAVGTFDSYTKKIKTGYSKRYNYDKRLLTTYPPFFPGCGVFEIASWFE